MSQSSGKKPDDEDALSETQKEVLHWIRTDVWSGEYDEDEVALIIEENLTEDDEIDAAWMREAIRREFAAKRKEEKTWPKVTDFDRLELAFLTLEQQGVIALHIAGFTQSDGLDDVVQTYHEAGAEKPNYSGHCFYTTQDMERALDGGGLCIGFGHLSGDDDKGVDVGNRLRVALEQAGLEVSWDGTIRKRLYIEGFKWQRRGP